MDSFVVTPLILVMSVFFVGLAFLLGCYLIHSFLKWKMIKKIKLLSPPEQSQKQKSE
jgi:hypothetical protein